MKNELYIKNFDAASEVQPHRLVVFGDSDTKAAQATDGSAAFIGVSDSLGAADAGEPMDVVMAGAAEVELGGTVTRGDRLTADAQGRAVKASAGDHIVGIAMMAGDAGDHGSVMIDRSAIPAD
ncbi:MULTISPECIES: capsid cement protein [unclassified Thioalkalivibrio]|uniref:capsid cement protein n=1 Tax=unclassified Thioalkalivibrio TaxID=2621013 RepID=UPI00037257E0|nr:MULTISPECIES: capsid cement protein [unclassified Thioalkalivibrio]